MGYGWEQVDDLFKAHTHTHIHTHTHTHIHTHTHRSMPRIYRFSVSRDYIKLTSFQTKRLSLEQVEEEIKSGGEGDREGQRYTFILVRCGPHFIFAPMCMALKSYHFPESLSS